MRGVLLLRIGPGHRESPWFIGALTGVSVLIGAASRSNEEALASARAATAAVDRAAESDAAALALAERGRIARDVHDLLAHSLAAVNMQLEVADAMIESGDPAAAQQATHRAQNLVREGLTEVQRTVRGLREDTLPLVATLRAMLVSVGSAGECACGLQQGAGAAGPVRAGVRTRRAGGSVQRPQVRAGSSCTCRDRLCRRRNRTDGPQRAAPAGARPLQGSGSGTGLVGMRERVALAAGTVQAGPVIDGADAGGWQVYVTIPT